MTQLIKEHVFPESKHCVEISYGDGYHGLPEGKSIYTVYALEYEGFFSYAEGEIPAHHYSSVCTEYFEHESDALAAFNIRTKSLEKAFRRSGLENYRW